MDSHLSPAKSTRYRELDALRGIAALMVVLFHFTMGRDQADLGFKLGTTGVDLFFIISGFVISMSIDRVSSGVEFVINRASRLYPTYWTCVTLTFVLITMYDLYKGESIKFLDYLGNMTMFQFYLGIPNLDEPYWTMIVEMVFYIFILFLFSLRILNRIVPIGIAISLTVILTSYFFWDNSLARGMIEFLPLLEFFPLFFAGILFYKLKNVNRADSILYLILLGCLVAQILLFSIAGRSRSFISQGEYAWMLIVFFSLFTLFVNNRLKFLIVSPLVFLGKISFALYLIHQYLILGHVLPFLMNKLQMNFWVAALGICLPIVVLLASAITFLVEVPYSAKMRNGLGALLIKKPLPVNNASEKTWR